MKQGLGQILKFVAFLFALPLIVAVALAFQNQILGLPVPKEQWFFWGVIAFTVIYLFLYNFKEVHVFGQGLLSKILQFAGSVASVAALVVPIYTIILCLVYFILNMTGASAQYEWILLTLVGFSVALHIVLTARQLYEEDSGSLKAQYFFGFGLALVMHLLIMAVLLGLVVPEFSLAEFLKASTHQTGSYYHAIYTALFVPGG